MMRETDNASDSKDHVRKQLSVLLSRTDESAVMTGRLHVLIQTLVNDNRATARSPFQPMSVRGADTVSDHTDRATALTKSTGTTPVVSFPPRHRAYGHRGTLHTSEVTVSANGEAPSFVGNFHVTGE